MTSVDTRQSTTKHFAANRSTGPPPSYTQPFGAPTRTPRLLLRGRGARTGNVDGAWWPWTDNLTAELHDLIAALTPRLGNVRQIGFDWNRISRAQRGIDLYDGVRMHAPDADQPPGTMRLAVSHGPPTILRVIPFDTPPEPAAMRMWQASGRLPPLEHTTKPA